MFLIVFAIWYMGAVKRKDLVKIFKSIGITKDRAKVSSQ